MLGLRACSAAGSVDENASSSAASVVPDARMGGCKQRVRFGASGIVEGRFSYSCDKGGQTGGQKATLVGRILAFVSLTISASCTTLIGAPPCPLHTPSISPPMVLRYSTEIGRA